MACGCHERDTYPILIYEVNLFVSGYMKRESIQIGSLIVSCVYNNDAT